MKLKRVLLAAGACWVGLGLCAFAESCFVAKHRDFEGKYNYAVLGADEYTALTARVREENSALPAALDSLKEKWQAENKIPRKERKDHNKGRNKGKGQYKRKEKREMSKPFRFDAPSRQVVSKEGPFVSRPRAEARKAELEASAAKTLERKQWYEERKVASMSENARESYEAQQKVQMDLMAQLQAEIEAVLSADGSSENVRRLGEGGAGSIDRTSSRLTNGGGFQKPEPKLSTVRVKGRR